MPVSRKMIIRPGFSGTVLTCNDVSRKNLSSSGTPICPVFGLVSRIYPDLLISAAVCLCIGGQRLTQILSVYTINCWRTGLQPGPHWGSSRHYSRPQAGPPHPTIHAFGRHPRLQCPNYGHLSFSAHDLSQSHKPSGKPYEDWWCCMFTSQVINQSKYHSTNGISNRF